MWTWFTFYHKKTYCVLALCSDLLNFFTVCHYTDSWFLFTFYHICHTDGSCFFLFGGGAVSYVWCRIASYRYTMFKLSTVSNRLCLVSPTSTNFWINEWRKNVQNKSRKWLTEQCMYNYRQNSSTVNWKIFALKIFRKINFRVKKIS